MDHDELRALLALERDRVAYDDDPATPEAGIVFLPGTRPVLLSAPHATRHRRAGRWKREEEYTAALVHRLHQRTGAHAL
ncbi:MAG: hypothetical protein JW910_14110, partial [Anaerolineae bacterium]|nr:hypothetical protein [Anaerolineae bacterium]